MELLNNMKILGLRQRTTSALNFLSIAILLILINASCKKEPNLETTEYTFILDKNFKPNHMHSGIYYDKKTQEELFFLGELTSAKKMIFLNKKGETVHSISFRKFFSNTNCSVNDVFVASLDSIYLLSNYTNELYLVNRNGELINHILLNETNKDLKKHELYSSIFSSFSAPDNPSFIFSCDPSIDIQYSDGTRIKEMQGYYEAKRQGPLFVEFKNNMSDNPKFHLKGKFKDFIPKNSFHFEFSFYSISAKHLIFSSWYSNKLFVYDYKNERMVKEIDVKSQHTDIGARPFQINKKNHNKHEQLLRKIGAFKGQIDRFYFDDTKELLYVIVFHEQKDLNSEIMGAARPWSLIVYDKKFEKILEKKFNSKKYASGFTMLSKDGLYVRKQKDKPYTKSNDKKYYSFDLVKLVY